MYEYTVCDGEHDRKFDLGLKKVTEKDIDFQFDRHHWGYFLP